MHSSAAQWLRFSILGCQLALSIKFASASRGGSSEKNIQNQGRRLQGDRIWRRPVDQNQCSPHGIANQLPAGARKPPLPHLASASASTSVSVFVSVSVSDTIRTTERCRYTDADPGDTRIHNGIGARRRRRRQLTGVEQSSIKDKVPNCACWSAAFPAHSIGQTAPAPAPASAPSLIPNPDSRELRQWAALLPIGAAMKTTLWIYSFLATATAEASGGYTARKKDVQINKKIKSVYLEGWKW